MASNRAWRLERKRVAPQSKWWPWSFCCYGIGWESRWCLLDLITKCKVRWICNHHDKVITGYDTEALATMPDWEAEAAISGEESLEMAESSLPMQVEALTSTKVSWFRTNNTTATCSSVTFTFPRGTEPA